MMLLRYLFEARGVLLEGMEVAGGISWPLSASEKAYIPLQGIIFPLKWHLKSNLIILCFKITLLFSPHNRRPECPFPPFQRSPIDV